MKSAGRGRHAASRVTGTIVIGLGAHGAAALLALAQQKEPALGIERSSVPNTGGSSHGSSRIIRLCYYEHPDYVPLLRRAYAGWARLEKASRIRLLLPTGGVYFGTLDHPDLTGALTSAKKHHLTHTLLSPAAARRAFPQFTFSRDTCALVEPTAGVLLPERAVSTMVSTALALGATIRAHEQVTSWQADRAGVVVRTTSPAGTFEHRARRLIIAAGPWTTTLLPDLALPLKVTRQTLAWVWPKRPALFSSPRLGIFAAHNKDGSLHYGFPINPETADTPGFKIAHHAPMSPADPDAVDRRIRPEDESSIRTFIERHIPHADGPLLALRTCLYTSTPDGHFILDRHPRHNNVTFASACSGHGFKFAPVIGEALADLALTGTSRLPIGFLSLNARGWGQAG